MNLTFLVFFLIIVTIIIDLLTDKREEDDIAEKKVRRTLKSFLSIVFTYLIVSLIFTLSLRYILVPHEYQACDVGCQIILKNDFVVILIMIIQILNIYNFYENYVHTYRFLATHSKLLEKIMVFLFAFTAIIFNEFLISFINLNVFAFNYYITSILMKLITYSTYIFLPTLVLIRELDRYLIRKRQDY